MNLTHIYIYIYIWQKLITNPFTLRNLASCNEHYHPYAQHLTRTTEQNSLLTNLTDITDSI